MEGIFIKKRYGEQAIRLLNDSQLLRHDFTIAKYERELGLVVSDVATAKSVLQSANIPCVIRRHSFTSRKIKPRSIQDYLRPTIPKELHPAIPSSFDTIGSIAVIDLKSPMLPFKHAIADAILHVHPTIKSVYRKSNAVTGEHRLRALEHIGGLSNTKTIHTEYGIKIALDVAKVYFSPRLSTEHHRIAQLVQKNELVLDFFTASGAFPLHITQFVHSHVVAVDINPTAIDYLQQSLQINKLVGTVEPICIDAREFTYPQKFMRILMNHPSGSKNFLKTADSLLQPGGIIHYYSFVPIEDFPDSFVQEFESELSDYEYLNFTKIRQYSPDLVHAVVDAKKA